MQRRKNFDYIGGGGRGRKREHVVIAERALGKPLPAGAIVHHLDEDPRNNDPTNLVICPDAAYHRLLHKRAKALAACGNANWLWCQRCKTFGPPEAMAVYGRKAVHPACAAAHTYSRRKEKTE